ncbi:hypothetical protein B0H14DRAFT_2778244 [Mycena olivaceomarginata]|nr:hypothetical protein B0H14DRAFT_2778244 [Mycena olivaceomarginata]
MKFIKLSSESQDSSFSARWTADLMASCSPIESLKDPKRIRIRQSNPEGPRIHKVRDWVSIRHLEMGNAIGCTVSNVVNDWQLPRRQVSMSSSSGVGSLTICRLDPGRLIKRYTHSSCNILAERIESLFAVKLSQSCVNTLIQLRLHILIFNTREGNPKTTDLR